MVLSAFEQYLNSPDSLQLGHFDCLHVVFYITAASIPLLRGHRLKPTSIEIVKPSTLDDDAIHPFTFRCIVMCSILRIPFSRDITLAQDWPNSDWLLHWDCFVFFGIGLCGLLICGLSRQIGAKRERCVAWWERWDEIVLQSLSLPSRLKQVDGSQIWLLDLLCGLFANRRFSRWETVNQGSSRCSWCASKRYRELTRQLLW